LGSKRIAKPPAAQPRPHAIAKPQADIPSSFEMEPAATATPPMPAKRARPHAEKPRAERRPPAAEMPTSELEPATEPTPGACLPAHARTADQRRARPHHLDQGHKLFSLPCFVTDSFAGSDFMVNVFRRDLCKQHLQRRFIGFKNRDDELSLDLGDIHPAARLNPGVFRKCAGDAQRQAMPPFLYPSFHIVPP